MNTTKNILMAICATGTLMVGAQPPTSANNTRLHRFSKTIERERPQLDDVTKSLIAAYRRNPSEDNRAALEKQVEVNYDKVLARKKAKLEELRREAGADKVREMEGIVNEMIEGRERRIRQTMSRFTDKRFKPGIRSASDGYHIVLGAPNVSIAHSPVTVGEYAQFCRATGLPDPKDKSAEQPVTNVSLTDAESYCRWLTENDNSHAYRLPTAEEWELAAGHMPKDADFDTVEGACGAVKFWGYVWQLTSTQVGDGVMVKGGAKDSPRTRCRTEIRNEVRNTKMKYSNVGFRVVRKPKMK